MSAGITEQEAELIKTHAGEEAVGVKGRYTTTYYHGKDWHETMESATARAEVMRAAKLISLEKSAAKIRAMDFTKLKEGK